MIRDTNKLTALLLILLLGLAFAACAKESNEESGEEGAASSEEAAAGGESENEAAEPAGDEAAQPAPGPEEGAEPQPTSPATRGMQAHGFGHAAEQETEMAAHDPMDNVLAEGDYDPAALVTQPGATVGDVTTCPVSQEVFRVTDDSPHVTHDDQEIYFCCPSCIRRFQRNPDSYLGLRRPPQ